MTRRSWSFSLYLPPPPLPRRMEAAVRGLRHRRPPPAAAVSAVPAEDCRGRASERASLDRGRAPVERGVDDSGAAGPPQLPVRPARAAAPLRDRRARRGRAARRYSLS